MDYKKIIKSRELRIKMMRVLGFIPDKPMLQFQYRVKKGRKLNLKNPQRYTEKVQWYKLYYRNPLMPRCVDKWEVRKYLEEQGMGYLLNPCLGLYDSADQVDFDALPDAFVLKDTLGSGGNSVIICPDKSKLDIPAVRKQMDAWVKTPVVRGGGREWPYYSGKKHRIIVERFIPSKPEDGGLIDYKFMCFDGKVKCIYLIADRQLGNGAGFAICDENYNMLDVQRPDERPLEREIPKPEKFDEMVEIAEKLSSPYPHARVDLYCVEGNIIFGEITFFDASGYTEFDPDDYDLVLGSYFNLPPKITE